MINAAIETQEQIIFRPQKGPQEQFLRCKADVIIYGGAAGGGKTFGVLLEASRGVNNKNHRCLIFRRQSVEIAKTGGLWDEASKIYPLLGAKANSKDYKYTFRSGAVVQFSHLQYESDMFAYQGTQANTIMFDELTHFLERQFWYMFTRNRSPAGLPCLIRATCNPDADSWVKDLIKWYLKPDGLPDYTRAGKIRYFLRINEQMYWASTREELMVAHNCEATDIKSFTFIPANLQDNQILMQNDPRYIANLKAQNVVERDRLLYGNWNIKTEGKVFKQQDFIPYLIAPKFDYTFMFIDTASKTKEHNDYSVLQLWGKGEKGIYLVDQLRGKWQAPELEIMTVSFVSKHSSVLKLFIEDASAGSALIQKLQRTINKPIIGIFRDKDKYSRAWECQAYVTSGYVHLNPMNDYYIPFIGEVTGFTADDKHAHDDQVDCMMDAIDKMLIRPDMPLKPAEYVSMSSRVV